MANKMEKINKKGIKDEERKIKVLAHELLTFTLSYLMLISWWYFNPSNLSSRTPPKFGLPLPLFPLPVQLITLLQTAATGGLR
jgi:hypothetical protein